MSAMRLMQVQPGKKVAPPEGRAEPQIVGTGPHKEGTQEAQGREEKRLLCWRGYRPLRAA